MSLFRSMETSSVASSALSPESTVTSLLSRSGHLRSSLVVPEHNTTFRYRDKVQFCCFAVLRSSYSHDVASFLWWKVLCVVNFLFVCFFLGWVRIMSRLLQPWMPTLQILRTAAMTQSHCQQGQSAPAVPHAEPNWAQWETETVSHHIDILLYYFMSKKYNNMIALCKLTNVFVLDLFAVDIFI